MGMALRNAGQRIKHSCMNRIDRLMGITLLLQGRRVTRAEDIAGHFEISLRTVYRDIAALSELGVPIVAEAGIGYSLMKGYFLPPITFTEDEAAALGMAAMALRRTSDPSLEASIKSALLKVKAALPREQRDRLERIEKSVAFGWGRREGLEDNSVARLVDIQRSLAEGRALQIDYRTGGLGDASRRHVEPLGLVYYLERWHLIAWCRLRDAYRDFRLDRVDRLVVLPEKVERRREFVLGEYLESQRSVDTQIATRIFFRQFSVDRAKREWSLGLVSEERVDGGSILDLTTGNLEWMVGWLLSFRDNADVLEPLELRNRLAEEARALWERYARPAPLAHLTDVGAEM